MAHPQVVRVLAVIFMKLCALSQVLYTLSLSDP